MYKKIMVFVSLAMLSLNLCGCFMLLAGTAGGAGTATWLSGKLSQEFNAPYERTIDASKKSLSSMKLEIAKMTKEADVTQIKSKYTDGKEIWVDIRKVTDNSTKVEVRVGAINPDKVAADKILNKIKRYL